MKKLLCLMLCATMMFGSVIPTYACDNETETCSEVESFIETISQKPELELANNEYIDNNRSFKVRWSKVNKAVHYEIMIADNKYFKDAVVKKVFKKSATTGRSYTYAGGEENKTYYIKVRPVFYYSDYQITFGGRWSDTVIAEAI